MGKVVGTTDLFLYPNEVKLNIGTKKVRFER